MRLSEPGCRAGRVGHVFRRPRLPDPARSETELIAHHSQRFYHSPAGVKHAVTAKKKVKKEKGRKEDLSLSSYETLTMQTPISVVLISLLGFPRISISRL